MRLGRSILCLSVLLVLCSSAYALSDQYAYRITFPNKQGTVLSLSNPLSFLSQRAIDRRTHQSIAIDSTDLPVSPAYLDSVLTLVSGSVLHVTSRWLNSCVILVSDTNQVHNLWGKSFVTSIRLVGYYAGGLHNRPAIIDNNNFTSSVTPAYIPLAKTTGSATYYGSGAFVQTSMVSGDFLHDLGYKGQGMLIAIVDNGYGTIFTNPFFDSLTTSGRIVDQYDFVLHTSTINTLYTHGLECLSQLAANIPGQFVGSAPYANYALYVTEIETSEQRMELDNMVAGAERADSAGADIITSSLGYDTFDTPSDNFVFANFDGVTTIVAQAANMATKKGMLFITSAGNEGGNTWNNILTPGDADSALTIGSVDAATIIATSSGWGPNAALQRKPDVCALGHEATIIANNGVVTTGDGTSYSTPQIAGWAACLWQASPSATPYMLRTAINKSADHYATPDDHRGYGVPNFHTAYTSLGIKDTPVYPTNTWIVLKNNNPITDKVLLEVSQLNAQDVAFALTDISGKVVWSTNYNMHKGLQLITFTPPALAPGIYMLRAVSSDRTQVIKLVKE
ncbi:MAG: S8 family peptidase [Bacteroidota bacterium]